MLNFVGDIYCFLKIASPLAWAFSIQLPLRTFIIEWLWLTLIHQISPNVWCLQLLLPLLLLPFCGPFSRTTRVISSNLYFQIGSVCLCVLRFSASINPLYPATDCAAATDISGVSARWQLAVNSRPATYSQQVSVYCDGPGAVLDCGLWLARHRFVYNYTTVVGYMSGVVSCIAASLSAIIMSSHNRAKHDCGLLCLKTSQFNQW